MNGELEELVTDETRQSIELLHGGHRIGIMGNWFPEGDYSWLLARYSFASKASPSSSAE
ncbi:MAG: hypothetical protein ACREVR_16205 [Burkholderiales bacterium]